MLKELGVIMSLNMDEKITVRNLCEWTVSFKRLDDKGDVLINANTTARLPRSEVISQVQSRNTLFSGTDGLGSHARIYIEDKDTRVELDFEDTDGKKTQFIVDDNKIKELFAIKTKSAFEKAVREAVVTNAEKSKLVSAVKKLKFNEYDKITFIQEYTGMSVN